MVEKQCEIVLNKGSTFGKGKMKEMEIKLQKN
jgi:hypothetical protein